MDTDKVVDSRHRRRLREVDEKSTCRIVWMFSYFLVDYMVVDTRLDSSTAWFAYIDATMYMDEP